MNKANPWNADVPFSYDLMWLASDECQRAIQRKTTWNRFGIRFSIIPGFFPLDFQAVTGPLNPATDNISVK